MSSDPGPPRVPDRQGSMEDLIAEEDHRWQKSTVVPLRDDDAHPPVPEWPPVTRAQRTPKRYLQHALPVASERMAKLDLIAIGDIVSLLSPLDTLAAICDAPGSAERLREWMIATDRCLGPAASTVIFMHLCAGVLDPSVMHAAAPSTSQPRGSQSPVSGEIERLLLRAVEAPIENDPEWTRVTAEDCPCDE